jgi:hypothetical protein
MSHWEEIGKSYVTGSNFKRVPKWVQSAMKHFHSPNVATGTIVNYYLKGRHFKYKIVDNNYDSVWVYRKKRRNK